MGVVPLVVVQRHARCHEDNLQPNSVAFVQPKCRLESQLTFLVVDAVGLVHEAPADLSAVQEETDAQAEELRTLREIGHSGEREEISSRFWSCEYSRFQIYCISRVD